jgi:heat-inducible transcriptional repressor
MALSQAATYINAEFSGLTLDEARAAIIGQMHRERALYDALMARALELAQAGLAGVEAGETLHVQGASSLFDELVGRSADYTNLTLDTARALVQLIEEKHRLISLLTQYMEASGVTVVIGVEHSSPDLQPFSVVVSTFDDGQRSGTVGVIGPTRMRYQRSIAIVDGVSQAISKAIEGQ